MTLDEKLEEAFHKCWSAQRGSGASNQHAYNKAAFKECMLTINEVVKFIRESRTRPEELRAEVIEECAKVCESWGEPHCKAIANSIRALKGLGAISADPAIMASAEREAQRIEAALLAPSKHTGEPE